MDIPTNVILEIKTTDRIRPHVRQILYHILCLVWEMEQDPVEWAENFCNEQNMPPVARAALRELAEEVERNAGRDPDDPDDE